jgi:hypothetical protein
MSNRIRLVVGLVLVGLLAGCSCPAPGAGDGGEGVETPSGGGGAEATVMPKDDVTASLPPAVIVDRIKDVEADPQDTDEWREAKIDMEIPVKGRVKAEAESTALVGVDEGLVRVAPNTMFTYLRPDEDTLTLDMEDPGQMWLKVGELEKGKTVQVETADAVAAVRGTRWSSRVLPDGTSLFSTQVGTITVASLTGVGGPIDVGAGYQTTVDPSGKPGKAEYMSPEEQARWGMAGGPNLDVVLPVVSTLYTATMEGSGSQPVLSPSGDYLVIMQSPLGGHDRWPVLYDVSAGMLTTTTLPANATHIDYGPSSGRMVYALNGSGEICTANEDGTDPSCFILPDHFGFGGFAWSPDETWILFTSYSGGVDARNLYKMHPDGTGLVALTDSEMGQNDAPSWSPDGSQIAYNVYQDHGTPAEMWVMDSDGMNARALVTMTKGYVQPAWSPDGSMLAVPGYVDYDAEVGYGVWLAPLDGSDPWMVPGTEDWRCGEVTWSPTSDGWPIFFSAYGPQVYRSGLHWYDDDSDVGPQYYSGASWGPLWPADGTHVVFGHGSGHDDDARAEVWAFNVTPGLYGGQE